MASALLGSCTGTPQEEDQTAEVQRPQQLYSIEQFINNTSLSGGSFSADESKILVSTDESGIYNLYSVPVAGGEMTALTESDSNSFYAISYFPEDDRVLFASDNNGDEIYHVFLREEDGTIRDLTPWEGARSSFAGWAEDEQSFFITSNKRDPRFMDLYKVDLETFEPTLVYQNDAGLDVAEVSDDERYLALTETITTNDNHLYLYDTETKEQVQLDEQRGSYSPAYFSPDSKSLFYLTNAEGEFTELMRYDIATGQHEQVQEAEWDIMYTTLSEEGTYRVTGTNADAKTEVQIENLKTGEPVEFPEIGEGEIKAVRIAPSEKQMLFYAGSSKSPSNLYVYNLETGEHRALTNTLNEAIDPDDLVEGEVVRYESFDGTEIPSILYMPHQAEADSPVPALVWVHGGPGGQSRLSYFPLIQYLVNHGYAILAVNNRGSSGYGKTFYGMDDRKHGEDDLQDVIEGKNYLAGLETIDSSKIGIIGGSYGGYMTMAAMTFEPEEFEVGVNLFGVTNWLRTLKSIPPWWESFREALYTEMGDPAVDSARLYRISPLFHAENIENPVMVLQGAQDPRVLKVESDEIVEAARKNNVPVEYVLFEDEGHGFVKKENQIEAYGKVLTFLDEYLKGEETEAAAEKM